MNQSLRIFLYGLLGSAAVEVVKVVTIYETGRRFPVRYRKRGFWIVRILLGLVGGVLAIAYGVQSDILAIHVGATTPTIIETFARRLPGDEPEPKQTGANKEQDATA
jgi:hypothetical protein